MFGVLCGNTLFVLIHIIQLWFLGCIHLHLYDVNILVVPSLSVRLAMIVVMG
jgi:hypothetical protein